MTAPDVRIEEIIELEETLINRIISLIDVGGRIKATGKATSSVTFHVYWQTRRGHLQPYNSVIGSLG